MRIVGIVAVAFVAVASAGASTRDIPVSYQSPSWSPDGKRIAFVSNRDDPNAGFLQLEVASADGTNVQRLTSDALGKTGPTWSPDGRTIAFQAYAYLDAVSPDGSNRRRLAVDHCCGAEWSPSGRLIAYAWSNETSGGKIFVVRRDGTRRQLVAAPRGYYSYANPTWSPDGQRLAFNANSAPDSQVVVPFVGIVSQYRGRVTVVSRGRQLGCLDWSPNGRKLLVCDFGKANNPRFEPQVETLDLRTHKLHRLAAGWMARWSPNGRRIVFINRGGTEIDLMNADGSGLRRLLP